MTRWRVVYRRGAKRDTGLFEARKWEDAALIAIMGVKRGWGLVGLWKKCAARIRVSGWVGVSLENGRAKRKSTKRKRKSSWQSKRSMG